MFQFLKPRTSIPIALSVSTIYLCRRKKIYDNLLTQFNSSISQYFCLLPFLLSSILKTVELQVHMDCKGCEKRVRKAISKLQGVDIIEIDMDKQKVTVTGYVDERKVLKVVRRTGRQAEFWPSPYDGEYYPFALQYLEDSTYSSTYNYYSHGYNSTVHGYFPDPAYTVIIDDDAAALFNDDNVHACLIM